MSSRVALFTGFFPPAYKAGGPVRSTANIVATAPEDCSLLIVTGDRDLGDTEPFDVPTGSPQPWGRHEVIRLNPRNPRQLLEMVRAVRHFSPEIIYVNSLWSPWFSMLPAAVASLRLWSPTMFLIAPRGEVQAEALSLKPRKKQVATQAWRVIRRRINVWWHATDAQEANEIQAFCGDVNNVLISLNPVDLPVTPRAHTRALQERKHFVVPGRVSPKKNQHILLKALQNAPSNLTLHIYGAIHDRSYHQTLLDLAETAPQEIIFHGAVEHEKLLTALNSADGMLLPTRGENFGHVIPEALSQSCPVYVDAVTPFTPTIRDGGGEIINHRDPQEWADLLTRLYAETEEQSVERHAESARSYIKWLRVRESTSILKLAMNAVQALR